MALDLKAVFRDNLAILGRDHGRVAHVPAESLEKRVDQGLADMGLLDPWRQEGLTVGGEVAAQLGDFILALVECFAQVNPSFAALS